MSNRLTPRAYRRFVELLRPLLVPTAPEPVVEWIQRHVDLSYDLTAAQGGGIVLYPYQVEALQAADDRSVRELTLMWAPRLGKSTVWKMELLKRIHDGGVAGLIVYPNLAMGLKTNEDTLLPLLRTQPNLRADLAAPGGRRKDGYHLPSARSVIYFLGGGAQVINYTASLGILDESDYVDLGNADAEGQNVDQRKALQTRMRTYPERLLMTVSSPTGYTGTVYKAWQAGSRGVWHLRCLGCGALHPASQLAFPRADGTFAGLQWRKTEAGEVIADSVRWVCPTCGREHTYAEAPAMTEQGAYVHANPDSRDRRSYQAGALANPALWPWAEIAEKQELATDPEGKKYLLNYVLGRPYKHVRERDPSLSISEALRAKLAPWPADLDARLSVVCAGVDQQASALAASKYYVYAVRGWDEEGNSWGLSSGIANSLDDLHAVLSAQYHGLPVALALLDAGGFGDNSSTTDPFIKAHPGVLYYKGGSDSTLTLEGAPWKYSDTQDKLVLANAGVYQVKLLDLLYGAPRPRGYRWAIAPDASPAYLEQLGAMQPNARMKNGDAMANWTPGSERHDYFDAEKMALCALDVRCTPDDELYDRYGEPYLRLFRAKFRRGDVPLFLRAERLKASRLAAPQK